MVSNAKDRKKFSLSLFILFFAGFFQIHCALAVTVVHKGESENSIAAMIDVKYEAMVAREIILLKDIADIDAGKIIKEKLGDIEIGPAPRPSEEFPLKGKKIVSIIQANKWILSNTKITIPEYVWVTRAFQTISDDYLKKLLYEYIIKNSGTGEYQLREFKVRGNAPLPVGKVLLNPFENTGRQSAGHTMTGRVSVAVLVMVNEKKEGTIFLSGWVDKFEEIICAKRSLPRGTVLTKSDLCVEEINVSKVTPGFITSFEDALGKRIKRNLGAGKCVKGHMLESLPLINKGDRVRLVIKSGFLEVVTAGFAKTNGAKDGRIQVENMKSAVTVMGVVKDASTVEVTF